MTDCAPMFRVPEHKYKAEHLKRLSVPVFRRLHGTRFCKLLILNSVPVFRVFPPIGASVARNNRAHHTLPTGGGA